MLTKNSEISLLRSHQTLFPIQGQANDINLTVIELYDEFGENLNDNDENGHTPIHLAVLMGINSHTASILYQ